MRLYSFFDSYLEKPSQVADPPSSILKISNIKGGVFNHILPHSIFTFQFLLFQVFILINSLISLVVASMTFMVSFFAPLWVLS